MRYFNKAVRYGFGKFAAAQSSCNRFFEFENLLKYGGRRRTKQRTSPINLPRENVNFGSYLGKITTQEFAESFFENDIPVWNRGLVADMIGKPQLCFLSCLCIIQIRKNAAPKKPLRLLKRLWHEYPDLLRTELSLRWIVSTMQAIALTTDDPIDRAICYAGITYSALLKVYESERTFMGLSPDAPYLDKSKHAEQIPEKFELGWVSIKSQDIACNLNADLYDLSSRSEFSGIMLQELIERISRAETIFSRLDREKIFASDSRPTQYGFCFFEVPELDTHINR